MSFILTENLITEGLVAYWEVEEGSGSTVADSWGGYDGTNSGGAWISGYNGKWALQFIDSGDMVELPDVPFDSGFTIIALCRPHNVANGNWNTLTRGTNDHQIILQSSTGELGMYDNAGGTGFHGTGYDGTQLENTWAFITSRGNGDGTTTFYVDKSNVGTVSIESTSDITVFGNYQGGGQPFGDVDWIRLYNRPLSEGEIIQIINGSG